MTRDRSLRCGACTNSGTDGKSEADESQTFACHCHRATAAVACPIVSFPGRKLVAPPHISGDELSLGQVVGGVAIAPVVSFVQSARLISAGNAARVCARSDHCPCRNRSTPTMACLPSHSGRVKCPSSSFLVYPRSHFVPKFHLSVRFNSLSLLDSPCFALPFYFFALF